MSQEENDTRPGHKLPRSMLSKFEQEAVKGEPRIARLISDSFIRASMTYWKHVNVLQHADLKETLLDSIFDAYAQSLVWVYSALHRGAAKNARRLFLRKESIPEAVENTVCGGTWNCDIARWWCGLIVHCWVKCNRILMAFVIRQTYDTTLGNFFALMAREQVENAINSLDYVSTLDQLNSRRTAFQSFLDQDLYLIQVKADFRQRPCVSAPDSTMTEYKLTYTLHKREEIEDLTQDRNRYGLQIPLCKPPISRDDAVYQIASLEHDQLFEDGLQLRSQTKQ